MAQLIKRRTDREGAMRINPEDAGRLGVADGDLLVCASRRGKITVCVQIVTGVQAGCPSLPQGFGLKYTGADGQRRPVNPLVNLLTASDHCDPLTKTPYQRNVPVRIQKA